MSKCFTYKFGDGVAVTYPAPGVSIEDAMQHPDIPKGVSLAVMETKDLPDRYFRAAWEFDGPKGVNVNIEKAKEVQRNVWRKLREPKLAALDIEFMQALEDASPTRRNAIKEKKNALRDVTLIELSDDLDAIKNHIPEILQ